MSGRVCVESKKEDQSPIGLFWIASGLTDRDVHSTENYTHLTWESLWEWATVPNVSFLFLQHGTVESR